MHFEFQTRDERSSTFNRCPKYVHSDFGEWSKEAKLRFTENVRSSLENSKKWKRLKIGVKRPFGPILTFVT